MRHASLLASVSYLFFAPVVGHAQTVGIQREVEAKRWFQRVLLWIEAVTGVPPAVALSILIAVVLAIVASIGYWYTRKK
jgi:hypothetical protein